MSRLRIMLRENVFPTSITLKSVYTRIYLKTLSTTFYHGNTSSSNHNQNHSKQNVNLNQKCPYKLNIKRNNHTSITTKEMKEKTDLERRLESIKFTLNDAGENPMLSIPYYTEEQIQKYVTDQLVLHGVERELVNG